MSGALVPDKSGNKVIKYMTQTYSGFDSVMGLSVEPFPESTYMSHEIFCEHNFGPNPCNGINGVFGSDFKSATNAEPGLWRLWLWLPEASHASYFDYNLQNGDEIAVWAGTYVNSQGSGTMFDTGYWQYGEVLVLSGSAFLVVCAPILGVFTSLLI